MRNLKETFALYFTGLRAALSSTPSMPKAQIAFIDMVWRYVLGLSFRLDRLIARWMNGTLPKSGAPRPARARVHTPGKARRFPLPSHARWLIRRMPATGIGAFGGQLQHLLANDAQMRAFLEAAPQARRLLGPLGRAFGINIQDPLASPPPRPAARAKPKAALPAIAPPMPPAPTQSRAPFPIPHPAVAFLRR